MGPINYWFWFLIIPDGTQGIIYDSQSKYGSVAWKICILALQTEQVRLTEKISMLSRLLNYY